MRVGPAASLRDCVQNGRAQCAPSLELIILTVKLWGQIALLDGTAQHCTGAGFGQHCTGMGYIPSV